MTNVSAQGLARLILIGSGIFVYVMVARFCGPEVLGHYALILAFFAILMAASDLGTTAILASGLAARSGLDQQVFYGTFLAFRLLLGLLTGLLALAALPFLDESIRWLAAVGCLLIPLLGARFFEPVFQVFGRPWLALACGALYAAVLVATSLAAIFLSDQPLLWVTGAYIGAGIVYGITGLALSWHVVRPATLINHAILWQILAFAGPIGISSVLANLNGRLDLFILAALRSAEEVGQYNAAYRFLDFGIAVAITVTSPLIPVVSRIYAERPSAVRLLGAVWIELVVLLCLPLAILTPLLSPAVMTIVFGETFADAAPVLNILVWVFGLICLGMLTTPLLLPTGRFYFAAWSTGIAVVLTAALNFGLVPRYGILGSAVTTLITEIWIVGIALIVVVLRLGNVFRINRLAFIAMGGIALAAGCYLPGATVRPFSIPAGLAAYVGLVWWGWWRQRAYKDLLPGALPLRSAPDAEMA
jgi:O-antigen/teichoic acid export membrane protein